MRAAAAEAKVEPVPPRGRSVTLCADTASSRAASQRTSLVRMREGRSKNSPRLSPQVRGTVPNPMSQHQRRGSSPGLFSGRGPDWMGACGHSRFRLTSGRRARSQVI